jgi:phosphatidate cytidylyltransferase
MPAAAADVARDRVLTALVLASTAVAALFVLPTLWLGVLFGAILLAAAWEWTALAGVRDTLLRALYLSVVALAGLYLLPLPALPVLAVGVAWWLGEALVLLRSAAAARSPLRMQLRGLFLLVPAWYAVLYLHQRDPDTPALLLFLCLLVWLADTAAYVVGTAYGRTPLAPRISPNKTVEGAAGAAAAVLVAALAAGWFYWRLTGAALAAWMVLAALTVGFAVLGDLVESRAKRLAGVKDSGHWLPGHGGVLDRIDAFLAAAPAFALGWTLWFKGGA